MDASFRLYRLLVSVTAQAGTVQRVWVWVQVGGGPLLCSRRSATAEWPITGLAAVAVWPAGRLERHGLRPLGPETRPRALAQ